MLFLPAHDRFAAAVILAYHTTFICCISSSPTRPRSAWRHFEAAGVAAAAAAAMGMAVVNGDTPYSYRV